MPLTFFGHVTCAKFNVNVEAMVVRVERHEPWHARNETSLLNGSCVANASFVEGGRLGAVGINVAVMSTLRAAVCSNSDADIDADTDADSGADSGAE